MPVPESKPSSDPEPTPEPTELDRPDPAQRFGAAAAEDAELADELTREADGDLDQAASRFAEEQQGPVSTETAAQPDA